jgi:hypothetical protein
MKSGSLRCSSIGFKTKLTKISRVSDLNGRAKKSFWKGKTKRKLELSLKLNKFSIIDNKKKLYVDKDEQL